MRALGYVRVSTAGQAEQGVSLEAQEQAIGVELERRGWELHELVCDTASAKAIATRPGLSRALELLDSGQAGALVVARLDRLSRSVGDFGALMDRAQRSGWAIVCLDPMVDLTTPFGRAMAGVGAVFAQLERELIAQRTREGIAAKLAAGGRHGREPEVPDEVVARIRALRRRPHRAIARKLEEEGVPTPRGGRWHHSLVGRVLERARA